MGFVTAGGTLLGGGEYTLKDCISFSFTKDRYSAAQTFNGKFVTDFFPSQFQSLTITVNGRTILNGYAEKQKTVRNASGYITEICAKSYSSLLESNHIQPGLYTDISFSGVFRDFVSSSINISCQTGTESLNYANFVDWTTLFDAFSHVAVRAYGHYPYVTLSNSIRHSLPTNIAIRTLTASDILEVNDKWDTSALISTIYMKDINNNYAAYSKSCPYTQSLGITRVKHIGIMRDWLFDIDAGLEFKLNMARRCHIQSVTYSGYMGEDIYSMIDIPSGYLRGITRFQVHAIEIRGDDKTFSTTVKHFDDYYGNMES